MLHISPFVHGKSQFQAGSLPHLQSMQQVTPCWPEHFASVSTLAVATREQSASLPTGAGSQAVVESTLPRTARTLHQWPSELQRVTPLYDALTLSTNYVLHPDKAWVIWLLDGIDNGVSIGYTRPLNIKTYPLQMHIQMW